jgi:hypothetical protein
MLPQSGNACCADAYRDLRSLSLTVTWLTIVLKMGWCRVPLLSDRREVRRSNDRMHAIGVAGTRSH